MSAPKIGTLHFHSTEVISLRNLSFVRFRGLGDSSTKPVSVTLPRYIYGPVWNTLITVYPEVLGEVARGQTWRPAHAAQLCSFGTQLQHWARSRRTMYAFGIRGWTSESLLRKAIRIETGRPVGRPVCRRGEEETHSFRVNVRPEESTATRDTRQLKRKKKRTTCTTISITARDPSDSTIY